MVNLENFLACDRDLDPDTAQRYLQAEAIALDTETMGLVPQRDRLCLVQLCDASGFVSAIRIQPGQLEAPQLKRVLENSNSVKVIHFARFDVAALRYHLGIDTAPIFCTKIASKLARTYTSSHGLKGLVQDLEGVELDKSAQSSDWGNAANLSEQQLSYAANDVRYLLGLREKLIGMLDREGRLELAQQAFGCVSVMVSLDLLHYKNIFEHS